MLTLRKIDFYGQLVLATLMLFSIPFTMGIGFLFGLMFLGTWQLLSASLNLGAFVRAGFTRETQIYWRLVVLDLLISFGPFIYGSFFNIAIPLFFEILLVTGLIGSVLIAIYYFKIYKHLLQHFELRNQLSGFTKSKPSL